MNVFFDVQGTLVLGGVPRPCIRKVFTELCSLGHGVYVWSSGGGAYAERAAKALGVEDLVAGCYSKYAPPPVSVDFAVDDQPSIVEAYGGYVIPPFEGYSEDRELLEVLRVVGSPGT